MDINKYIPRCYEIAKSKGFYTEDSKIEDHLMGIVSEIGEAYEADRNGMRFYNNALLKQIYSDLHLKEYTRGFSGVEQYKEYLSGTFEDELADIFIRIFNLCGWCNDIDVDVVNIVLKKYSHVRYTYTSTTTLLWNIQKNHLFKINTNDLEIPIARIINRLDRYCIDNNIPIEKHIQAKIEYNKTREYLHGKEY